MSSWLKVPRHACQPPEPRGYPNRALIQCRCGQRWQLRRRLFTATWQPAGRQEH